MRKDWEVKKLGEICEIQNGYAFRSALFREQGLPILRISNIQNDVITLDNIVYFLESDYNIDLDRFKVYSGDIVIALSGATTGKIGINKTDLTFYLNQRVALCRESNALIKGYLFYYLRTKTMELLSMAGGAAQPNLSTNQIQQLLISVPPLQIQQQVVEELDSLTSIIEKQKKQLEELDNLAQSIFYDMFGDPIANEKGWDLKKLDNICNVTSSKRIYAHEYVETGIPFYRGKEISEKCNSLNLSVELFISVEKYEELKGKFGVPKFGDLLLTAVGTIGNIWIVDTEKPFYFKDGNIIWIQKLVNVIPVFLKFLLELQISYLKNKLANGCAYSALTIMNLKELNIITPLLSLQQQFASKIEAIEKQKELIKKSIKETEDLFNSRMDYYFN